MNKSTSVRLLEVFKKATNSLNEIKAQDAKEKFYKDIDDEIYQQIIKLDPTYNESNDEFGKYTKWIIKMWKNKLLKEEDFYKIKDYLDIYHTYRNRIEQKDIMQIKTPRALYDVIEPYKDRDQPVSKSDEKRKIKQDANKVYEDNEWLVVVPKTEEAACYYGKGTQWCTAGRSENLFDSYSKSGDLFININKQTKEKFQFHFEQDEFMDEQNNPISFDDMEVHETDGLFQFYKKEGYDTDKLIPSLELLLGNGYIGDSERLMNYLLYDMKSDDYTYENLNSFIRALEGGVNYFWYDITYMIEVMLKDYKSEISGLDNSDFHNIITIAINDYDESSWDVNILERIAEFIDLIVKNDSLTSVDLEEISTLLTEKTTSTDIDGFELFKMIKEETINKLEEETDFDYADDLKDAKQVSALVKMSEKKNSYVLLKIINTTYDDNNNLKLNVYIKFKQSNNEYRGLVNVEGFYNLLNNYDLFENKPSEK